MSAADLILLRDDLGAVPDPIGLSRATFRTIRQNLGSFGYNAAAIPLAALVDLNPVLASAAITLSPVLSSRPASGCSDTTSKGNPMTATTYLVTGMLAEHCVKAVTSELGSLRGVSAVTVDLVPGGNSRVTVTSESRLPDDAVTAALDEAGGYQSTPG